MGVNSQGTVYDDLTLICRSDDKLEYFRDSISKVDPRQIKREAQSNTEEFVAMMTGRCDQDQQTTYPDNFIVHGGGDGQ